MSTVVARPPLGWSRLLSVGLLLAVSATVLTSGFVTSSSLELYGWDFRDQYYRGAEAVVEGEPLYLGPDAIVTNTTPYPYVYPPLTAVALVPVTLVSENAAVVIAVLASLAAVLAALALVGVRDLRCYLAVLASAPLWNILETANLTAALVLGLAIAWRLRSKIWPLAVVLGLAASTKLFAWPLLVWAAARHVRVAVYGSSVWAVSTLFAWVAIGFQGFAEFPALVERLVDVWAPESYSIVGMTAAIGFDPWVGRAASVVVGGVLLAMCVRYARRDDEVAAFTCAVAAMLALTPIAWQHYLLLLLVPLGVAKPKFSWVWLLPLAGWLSPRTGHGLELEPFVPGLVAGLLVAAVLMRSHPPRSIAEVA